MSLEEIPDWDNPPRQPGRAAIVALAVVVLVGAIAAFWLASGRTRPAAATVPATARSPAARRPPCAETELELQGAFSACAHQVSNGASACTISGPALSTVTVMSDGVRRYILYTQGTGAYRGPGDYPLLPWPDGQFGQGTSTVQVGLRDYSTGDFWRSDSGRLRVAMGARGGSIEAGLVPSRQSLRHLLIRGTWTC